LSHDQPLDVAPFDEAPEATITASERFLPYTSVRAAAADLGERLADDPATTEIADRLRQVVHDIPFDRESSGSAELARLTARIPEDTFDALTNYEYRARAMAGPPEAAAPQTPTDRRRLQTQLVDGSGRIRTDAFVAGKRHRLRVRIAAEVSVGVVRANMPFVSPTPGAEARLTVVARVRGSADTPVRRSLRLPPTADTAWTRSIPLDIPTGQSQATVEVVVLHQGRTVQSATLPVPVRPANHPVETSGLQLAIDVEPAIIDPASRASAAATLMVSLGPDDEPVVIDLTTAPNVIQARTLRDNQEATRLQLRNAFGDKQPSLTKAAPLLVELALQGSTLRDVLSRGVAGFHDSKDWIHALAQDDVDLPFELIYTHPAPEERDVPVCPPALNGATSCQSGCSHRDSGSVVCPFGFWGDKQGRRTPAAHPGSDSEHAGAVPPDPGHRRRRGQHVEPHRPQDPTATKRIVGSLRIFVGPDRLRSAASWNELPDAVKSVPSLLVLVTHTVPAEDRSTTTKLALELGGVNREAAFVGRKYVNPDAREPGPIVLGLGCDTDDLMVGYDTWVGILQKAGAEVVVSTLSPVPGKEMADFVVRAFEELPRQLQQPGPHRWGTLITAVRRATRPADERSAVPGDCLQAAAPRQPAQRPGRAGCRVAVPGLVVLDQWGPVRPPQRRDHCPGAGSRQPARSAAGQLPDRGVEYVPCRLPAELPGPVRTAAASGRG